MPSSWYVRVADQNFLILKTLQPMTVEYVVDDVVEVVKDIVEDVDDHVFDVVDDDDDVGGSGEASMVCSCC